MGDGVEGMSIEEVFEVSEIVRRVFELGYKIVSSEIFI